jgi:hypothetical protein
MDINWNILNLECKTSENGLSKVVSRIQWSCIATTTHEEKEYTTEIHGPVELSSPDPNNFVAYESLTKEQVKGYFSQLEKKNYIGIYEGQICAAGDVDYLTDYEF